MTSFSIRPYEASDRDALLKIWRAASEAAHGFFTQQQLDAHQQMVRDIYLPQAENWVAVKEAVPVGFIGLIDSHIGGLFVDPARHGQGYGRALVEHGLRLKGFLELEVYARNRKARTFYDRMGFAETGRRPQDDHGLPFELIKMRR